MDRVHILKFNQKLCTYESALFTNCQKAGFIFEKGFFSKKFHLKQQSSFLRIKGMKYLKNISRTFQEYLGYLKIRHRAYR